MSIGSGIGQFAIGISPIQGIPSTPPVVKNIPSYLYTQYQDDDDLQAFVAAFNAMAQEYIDWFASIQLPVYTAEQINGALLDWVALGLYGITRPTLPTNVNSYEVGAFNTFALNDLVYNGRQTVEPGTYFQTNDDIFKRVITWHFFKGDGKVFNIRWLKRRIMRFLVGQNGVNFNVDQTYQISISFGEGNQVNIRIISFERTVTGGAMFNRFALNEIPYNSIETVSVALPTFPEAAILQAAIDAGVLELPFQFSYVVTI